MHRNMILRGVRVAVAVAVVMVCAGFATELNRTNLPAGSALPPDPGWPRRFTDESGTLFVYQPQIETWNEFRRIAARFAVSFTPAKSTRANFGTVRVEADTLVDLESRSVALTDINLASVQYSSVYNQNDTTNYEAMTRKLFPAVPTTVSLDRVLAYMDTSQVNPRDTAVSLAPPPILVSTQPAVLVIIDGDPALFDIENTTLQKVVNTNWDLFYDKSSKRFYLRNDKSWLSAETVTDTWKPEARLPSTFTRLPDTEQYQEVKHTAASPQNASHTVLVLVALKPTELIVIAGDPALQPISGTHLSWVSNTECDLFFSATDKQYYFLTSGRWFSTPDLRGGKWEGATASLPEDFKRIPLDHPRSHVLASVPGTREAEEAVITALIPQVATIDRKTAKADVQYVGAPEFQQIQGTNVSYAVNTPNDVLKVGDLFYLCLDGVWFASTSPKGPWDPADKIPQEIYKIPPESPKHNVTYVTVYQSTPDAVTYGYTSGYTGMYVAFGVTMWGTGYYYPPYYGWGYYPYPVYWPYPYYTYGASAWYNPATGAYARGSAVYGPYGGYGRAAAYNPSTGAYAWGRSAWGPYGAAASGGFYNPTKGTWGGTYHASNGYQSWGQSVVGRGDQWARTGSYSDSRGTVAGVRTSSGGRALAARGAEGQGFVARSGAGDFYAGHDGSVYRRDQSGNWYKNDSGSWQSINKPTPARGDSSIAASRDQLSSAAQARAGSGAAANPTVQGLNRDAAARNWGNYNTQRATSAKQYSGGYSGARYGGVRGGRRR